jgi:hypothetical protein
MRKTKMVPIEYDYFEVGSEVTSAGLHSFPLQHGVIYTVIKMTEPASVEDKAFCCVEGHEYVEIETKYFIELKRYLSKKVKELK